MLSSIEVSSSVSGDTPVLKAVVMLSYSLELSRESFFICHCMSLGELSVSIHLSLTL
jgi:hypothetical protein